MDEAKSTTVQLTYNTRCEIAQLYRILFNLGHRDHLGRNRVFAPHIKRAKHFFCSMEWAFSHFHISAI